MFGKMSAFFMAFMFAVSLTACGAAATESEGDSAGLGVVNPMQAYTLQEIADDAGVNITLPTEIFAELSVFRYNFEAPLYQIGFKYTDGNNYIFRMQKAEELTDISGMYYSWTQQTEGTDILCRISTNDDGQGICLWFDGEYTYCISMDENASADILGNMCNVICSAMEK